MIHALTLILVCQLAGETLSRLFQWPVPGPVLGMAFLFALMLAFPRLPALVLPVGEGILRHLSLLFVPAGVGVVGHLHLLGTHGVAIALAIVVSTVLALAVGALTFLAVARLVGEKDRTDG